MSSTTLLVVSSTTNIELQPIFDQLDPALSESRHLLILRPGGPVVRGAGVTVLCPPAGLDIGAYQKIAFQFAEERGFEIICQLSANLLPATAELIEQLEQFEKATGISALYAARQTASSASHEFARTALRSIHNTLVGVPLNDLHSAYRLYRMKAISALPYGQNSDDRMFLIELTVQLVIAGQELREFRSASPLEMKPAAEMFRYGRRVLKLAFLQRVQRLGILYDTRFDLTDKNVHYVSKFDFPSSHSFALETAKENARMLFLGSGPADLVRPFSERSKQIAAVDQWVEPELEALCSESKSCNLDEMKSFDFTRMTQPFHAVYALDIIEHLRSPEDFLSMLRNSPSTAQARLILTTPNIALLPVRLMLFFGYFNYGKRGILDRTHTRLFTFRSLRRILEQHGFKVLVERGVPAPFPLAVGRNSFSALLLALNQMIIMVSKGLFSFQIYVEADPLPTAAELLRRAEDSDEMKRAVA